MELNKKIYKTKINGKEASLEFSNLANQADAAVFGRYGDTTVLAAVVMGKQDSPMPFFPLTVDYEEKFYAIGKILGSRFLRREGRPSDDATLSARLIDRAIRPLFDHRIRRDVQVTLTILSYDEDHDPRVIGLLAASAALHVSRIPWDGPVAALMTKDEERGMESFFAGPKDKINMIEFSGNEFPESELGDIFDKSQEEINKLVDLQEEIRKDIGVDKEEIEFPESDKDVSSFIEKELKKELEGKEKIDKEVLRVVKSNIINALEDEFEEEKLENEDVSYIFDEELGKIFNSMVLEDSKRPDGRDVKELRPLYAQVGILPKVHGSALFIRGNTQVLAIATLASPGNEQIVDSMEFSGKKRFMLHYNFPGYSVGEPKRSRGPGRREIGHGALAAKAIEPFLPSKEEFPYSMRVVTEVLSSNGSTSMASTCAAVLALMDAGVPIKDHVSGIAMGAIMESDDKWDILTDIQGLEDHYGGMDFKSAGTGSGVNAVQMDTKVRGIKKDVFEKIISQSADARKEILAVMKEALASPRPEISPLAPRIISLTVPVDKIGLVIGPGGKTINNIIEVVGEDVSIDIEDDGTIFVSGDSSENVEKALAMIKGIVKDYEVGEIAEGTVEKVLDFGAIVNLGGGKDGMIHVSELKDGYVEKVTDVVKEGDKVKVKVIKNENGKIGLTLKGIDQ